MAGCGHVAFVYFDRRFADPVVGRQNYDFANDDLEISGGDYYSALAAANRRETMDDTEYGPAGCHWLGAEATGNARLKPLAA